MKILIVGIYSPLERYKGGGPVAVFSHLSETIAKVAPRHEIDLVSQSYLHGGEIRLDGSKTVRCVPILKIKKLLLFITMILHKKYDVINLQGISELNAIVAIVAKIRGATLLYTSHGFVLDEIRLGRKHSLRLLIEERVITKLSDHIVTVSIQFKERIHKTLRYPRERISVIYNGISEYWLQNHVVPYKNEEANRYILFVGVTSKIKGFDILLRAFNALKKRNKGLRLFVVGKKPADELLAYAGEAVSDISFLQKVPTDALRQLYRGAVAFVLPSREDSFPLVVMEALSQGVPVVISDKVGATEIIEDGKHGMIFGSGDIDALCSCVETIIKHEDFRRKVTVEGPRLAASRSWQNVLDEYLKLFETISRYVARAYVEYNRLIFRPIGFYLGSKSSYCRLFGTPDLHTHIRYRAVRELVHPDRMTLDLGCGAGHMLIQLFLEGRLNSGMGVDSDPVVIEKAKQAVIKEGFRNLSFLVSDITDMDMKEKFEQILCIDILEHIVDDVKLLLAVNHLLLPGGLLVISVPTLTYPNVFGSRYAKQIGHVRDGYTLPQISGLLSRTGFRILEYRQHTNAIASLLCYIFYQKLESRHLQRLRLLLMPVLNLVSYFDKFATRKSCGLSVLAVKEKEIPR